MQGAPATAGSKILEGYRPPYDATCVSKLEAAGAVLLGKLNCDEFAMGSSNENSAYGPVRNPRGHRPGSGRLQRRLGGGGSLQHGRGHPGQRYRRLHSPARQLLRRGGCASHLWPRFALRFDRLCLVAGSRGAVGRQCARCRHAPGRDCRPRSQGCHQFPDPGAGLCRRKRQAGRRDAHRHSRRVFRRGPRSRGARRHREGNRRAPGCWLHRETGLPAPTPSTPFPPTIWWPRPRPAPTWPASTACATAIARRSRKPCSPCTRTPATKASEPRSNAASCSAPMRFPLATTTPTTLKAQQVRRLLAEEFLRAFADVDAIVTPHLARPAL